MPYLRDLPFDEHRRLRLNCQNNGGISSAASNLFFYSTHFCVRNPDVTIMGKIDLHSKSSLRHCPSPEGVSYWLSSFGPLRIRSPTNRSIPLPSSKDQCSLSFRILGRWLKLRNEGCDTNEGYERSFPVYPQPGKTVSMCVNSE